MTRTLVPSKVPTTAGVDPGHVLVNATDGNSFMCGPHTVLEVETTGTGANMTLLSVGSADGGALPNRVVALPSTGKRRFRVGDRLSTYRQSDGTVWVDWSAGTGITMAVVEP